MLTLTDVDSLLDAARAEAGNRHFSPRGTVRCVGGPMFKNQLARDLACLFDLDPSVREWSCLPLALGSDDMVHVPDFMVVRGQGACLVDAVETIEAPSARWIEGEAMRRGYTYERVTSDEFRAGARLANARDLLRYARWHCPLGDRVRLLAALDEHGSMTVAECLPAFLEIRPIAGLSSLILQRFVEIDLDEARIGPETQVRRSHS